MYKYVRSIVINVGGNYFSTHYHLGSKKFETAEEEQFLYGDMADVNYLVPPPSAVCYFAPPWRKSTTIGSVIRVLVW